MKRYEYDIFILASPKKQFTQDLFFQNLTHL